MLGQVPGDLKRVGAGLFHALANFNLPLAPPRGIRLCLTVLDLIPLTHPDSVSRAYRLQFGAWLSRSVAIADAVICISQATRTELVSRFPGVKAVVIHLGVDHLPLPARAPPRSLPPYLLYLGSLEARKRVDVLLAAYERLGDRSLGLVLAGSSNFGSEQILKEVSRLTAAGFNVRHLGSVAAEALPGLIAGAELLCAPSEAEGFSLPPLEALALGTPVVASAIPAHLEILGDAARLVPVGNVEALCAELRRVLDDTQLRAMLRKSGVARSRGFTWARAAQLTADVYTSVCP